MGEHKNQTPNSDAAAVGGDAAAPSVKQHAIIRALEVRPPAADPRQEIERIKSFLLDYLTNHAKFCQALVLGISGGQDSTLAGKICRLTVDSFNQDPSNSARPLKFIAVRLPYGQQADESDCQLALDFIKPDMAITVNIKSAVDASCASLNAAGVSVSDFAKGNEKARERMKAQYSIAAAHRGLVIGTDHAAEAVTGFYTKYGDGGTDINPLHGLTKRLGRRMLEALNCPEQLYLKKPTADLEDHKPGLPDEVALGVTYQDIDNYLEGSGVPDAARLRIETLYDNSAHKRAMPVTPPAQSQ